MLSYDPFGVHPSVCTLPKDGRITWRFSTQTFGAQHYATFWAIGGESDPHWLFRGFGGLRGLKGKEPCSARNNLVHVPFPVFIFCAYKSSEVTVGFQILYPQPPPLKILRADFREGDEDSNFSVFRVRRFSEWPEPLHWIAFPVEILTKPLIHWIASPLFNKNPFFHWKVLLRIPFPKFGSEIHSRGGVYEKGGRVKFQPYGQKRGRGIGAYIIPGHWLRDLFASSPGMSQTAGCSIDMPTLPSGQRPKCYLHSPSRPAAGATLSLSLWRTESQFTWRRKIQTQWHWELVDPVAADPVAR